MIYNPVDSYGGVTKRHRDTAASVSVASGCSVSEMIRLIGRCELINISSPAPRRLLSTYSRARVMSFVQVVHLLKYRSCPAIAKPNHITNAIHSK